jgi:hypothetical protein
MRYLRLLLLLLPATFCQVGCSSTSTDAAAQAGTVDANGEPVSSVPWNKPESWETNGQLGGLSGQ